MAASDVSVLALVPARGGSKGIPRKNLVPVGGHPLIWWSVQAGREAARVDRVVVSTDDDEIADAARAAGAEVPFLRPASLAEDLTPDLPVFRHALTWLADEEGYRPDLVVHLRPTSPARRPGLVDEAIERLLGDPTATAVRSVRPAEHPPHKTWWVGDDGVLAPVLGTLAEELFNQPRQSLPQGWLHDGVVDVIRSEVIRDGSMTGTRILALPMDEAESVDIDRPADLAAAEAALRHVSGNPPS